MAFFVPLSYQLISMLQKHYLNLSITFFISTIWCIYVFFDYFPHRCAFFSVLTLYFDYIISMSAVFIVSVIIAVLRLTKFKIKALNSFWYTFATYTNLLLFLMYMLFTIFSHQVKEFFAYSDFINTLVLLQLFLGLALFTDLYKNHIFKTKVN